MSSQEYVPLSTQLTNSLEQITQVIEANREIIDTIQQLSLQLTDVFGNLHTLTLKYAAVVNRVLDAMLPVIDKLPFVSDKVMDLLRDMERITQEIIDSGEKTARIITDIDSGLRQGDMSRLQKHRGSLQALTRQLQAMLPKD